MRASPVLNHYPYTYYPSTFVPYFDISYSFIFSSDVFSPDTVYLTCKDTYVCVYSVLVYGCKDTRVDTCVYMCVWTHGDGRKDTRTERRVWVRMSTRTDTCVTRMHVQTEGHTYRHVSVLTCVWAFVSLHKLRKEVY